MARRKALYLLDTWQGEPIFRCTICRQTAQYEADIVNHIRTMHPRGKAEPIVLGDSFSRADKVQVTPPPVPPATTEPSMSMTKLDLLALALEIGADFPPSATKAEIVASIRARQS